MGSSTHHQRKRARTGSEANRSTKHHSHKSPKRPLRPAPEERAQLEIQDCSFVHWDVSGICALAASPCERLIAVARSDGNVELRRKDLVWAVSSLVYGPSDPELAVTSVKFSACAQYVFVARLDGSLLVLQVTPEGLREHVQLEPGGGAIWDIAVSRSELKDDICIALACDDGCVRFIRPDPSYMGTAEIAGEMAPAIPTDTTHYLVKISETTNARVLSVAWAPPSPSRAEDCVVCGDADGGVRWLDPVGGSLYGRGKIPSLRQEKAMIWTITFANRGLEVICGDSRGMVTVWSSGSNTMNQELRIEALKGVLWSSTVVGEGTASETVFFGSAGGGVGGLQSSAAVAGDQLWVPLRGSYFHSHDVRAMSVFRNGTIVTGSEDARMCLFSLSGFVDRKKVQWVLPYPGCAGQVPVTVNREGKLMISRRRKGIDIWSIPTQSETPELRLRMNLKTFDSDLIACAISRDATTLAVSSFNTFRLYQVWNREGPEAENDFGKVRVISLEPTVESALRGCVDAVFCGSTVVAITRSRQEVVVYQEGTLLRFTKEEIGSCGVHLDRIVSGKGRIAVCDSRGRVMTTALAKPLPETSGDLPWQTIHCVDTTESKCVSQMCFSPSASLIAVAFTDSSVVVRRVPSEEEKVAVISGHFPCPITSMSFSETEESLLLSGEKFCAIVCANRSSRKRKAGAEIRKAGFEPFLLKYKESVLSSSVLDSSKIVVIRRRWKQVQSSLSEAIPRKPFGA